MILSREVESFEAPETLIISQAPGLDVAHLF